MNKNRLYTYLATALGIGYIPKAPGTFGSLAAMAVYIAFPDAFFGMENLPYTIAGLLLFCLFSVYVSQKAEQNLEHDAPQIVIDEFCGYFVSVLFLPKTLLIALLAFILFRVFDIAKPFPVNRSQKLPGGWGIVADDVLAGIYSNLCLRILILIFPIILNIELG